MKLKVYDHSVNYTCTIIKLPVKQQVDGLDTWLKWKFLVTLAS